jgi:hypothetical protein
VAEIAMWGAPASGKTTFLAALDTALKRRRYGYTMIPDDDASEVMLINATAALDDKGEFPDATETIDILQWTLHGRRQQAASNGAGMHLVNSTHKITLKLTDPNGELTLPGRIADPNRRKLVSALAGADGIIFMFDPIRESEKGDGFQTTNGLLVQLARQAANSDPNFDGMLPHHIAICVTKFDEPRVFDTAERLRLLQYDPSDPYQFPRVEGADARLLFSSLCASSGNGNGDLMLNALEQYFREDRIKFFVTSSVGFYVNPYTNRFDRDNPQNVVKNKSGHVVADQSRIRGPLHPINIVEPVLWLGERSSHVATQP